MLKSSTIATLRYLEQINDNTLCNSEIYHTDGFGGIYMQQTTILSESSEILQHATSILFGLQSNRTVSDLKAEFINIAQLPPRL